jgi:hypothetical protein
MTAATATDERRVALATIALVLGAVATGGASVMLVRWADIGPYASAFWRVLLVLPRAGPSEAGP